jgi:serine/threonine protein kinase
MSDSVGVVGGRYRLVRTIGHGGMGTVWQAHDEVLGRDVAVKEIHPPPDMSGGELSEFTIRTFREARAAGRVAHPGVATVYDVLEEHGHPWIVMQLVHSRTLGEVIRDEGPMPPARVAAIGLQILEALRAAHAAGVLHRDVKPDNVLLAEDGRAVLTDFGIATTEGEAPVTRTGVLVGTPAFIAPERAAGGDARPASDLWSLGVTLYVAVEGHSPFRRADILATLGAIMHAEPTPLARAGALGPVVTGLLRKDPVQRMRLNEAERRLHQIVLGNAPELTAPVPMPDFTPPGSTRPPPSPPSPPSTDEPVAAAGQRRRPPIAALAAGVLAVAVATGGAAWWSNRTGDSGPPSPRPTTVVSVESTVKSTVESTVTDDPSAPAPAPSSRHVRQDTPPPTARRTNSPTTGPSAKHSHKPSEKPSQKPSKKPSKKPTKKPAEPKGDTTPGGDDTSTKPGQVAPADAGRRGPGKGRGVPGGPGRPRA